MAKQKSGRKRRYNVKIDINLGNEHILEHFPNFEYFNCTVSRLNFFQPDNLVGDQQKAFILYHIIREVQHTGEAGITLGCGQSIEPFTIGIDHYYGNKHLIYGGGYYPHLTCKCEKLPFNDNTFSFAVAPHIFEHIENKPLETFKEWIRILKPAGALILIIPDANYENKARPWDFDHKMFYTPAVFQTEILDFCKDLIKMEVFNTLKNCFSINYVGRKI